MQGKTAETTDFDTLAPGERIAHQIQKVLDGKLNIFRGQVLLLSGDHFYEF